MIRTRVGYTGGTTRSPSYYDLGDHCEAIQIDYDPIRVSFDQLLEIFWQSHNPGQRPWSPQYRAVFFFHNDEQKRLTYASKERLAARLSGTIQTAIEPVSQFYRAEAYHQKFHLRRHIGLMEAFKELYPGDDDAIVDATAAARLNGYLGGYGSPSTLLVELDSLDLPEVGRQKLLEIGRRLERSTGLYC